jgi:hypothetical protein
MARNEQDPAASTQQFRAFANRGEAAQNQKSKNTGVIIGVVVGLVVVVALIAILALS